MQQRIMTVLAAIALTLLAAACSDDDDEESGGSGTVAIDEANPKTAVLQESDLPEGWAQAPSADDDANADAQLAACLGIDHGTHRPEAASDFSQGPITQIGSSVEIVDDLPTAEREFDAVASPRAPACIESAFEKGFEQDAGGELVDMDVTRLDVPQIGDGAVAYRIAGTLSVSGEQVPLVVDLLLFYEGVTQMQLTAVNAGEPIDTKILTDAAAKMAARA